MKNFLYSENISVHLAIIASFVFLYSCYLYNKGILKGENKPNIVSWGLFIILTSINTASYIAMSSDFVKGLLALTDLFTCIVIFSILLLKGRYQKLENAEWWAIFFSVISILVWYLFKSATGANITLQIAYMIAFSLTLRNAWGGKESILPWVVASIGMFLSIIVVIIRWTNHWEDLFNPTLAFSLHLAVAIIAYKKKPGPLHL